MFVWGCGGEEKPLDYYTKEVMGAVWYQVSWESADEMVRMYLLDNVALHFKPRCSKSWIRL